MADTHDKSVALSRRVVEAMADSVKAHVRRELAERDAEIARLREADARTSGVLDVMREHSREMGDEIQRLRRRCALIEDAQQRHRA